MTNDKSLPTFVVFVLKVFASSAIGAVVIKYVMPYIPTLASNELSESTLNAIALLVITLPVIVFAAVLWQKR